MRIGIVTAMAQEIKPIYEKLGNIVDESVIHGVSMSKIALGDDTVYLATSGVGEIRAAMAVQMLVDLYDVEVIINFGFVGALNKNIDISELVIADKVCHYQFDTSAIDGTKVGQYYENEDIYFYLNEKLITGILSHVEKPLRRVAVASGDIFIADKEMKRRLAEDFGCDICEMELAGLALACERNEIPLVSIKVVSDKADDNAPISFDEIVKNGISKYEEILPAVLNAVTEN